MTSRFVSPDLPALGDVPAVVDVDFETIRLRRADFLKAALAEHEIDFDVTTLETSPLMIAVARGGGYEETLFRQVINENIRALSLATAVQGNLDHIAATYYGIARQSEIVNDVTVFEDDERFRDRVALAPEAFSTAGPEGAYLFHALELDGEQDIADASVYSEEDGATYTAGLHADAYSAGLRAAPFAGRGDGDPVLAPDVLTVILPALTYGVADQALLDRAFDAVTPDKVRPLGDNNRIEPAEVLDYVVDMTITYGRGADPVPIVAEAEKRIADYVASRRRVGVASEILGIGGAGYVTGVESVSLASPAADVGGGSKQAPNCTGITVTAVQSDGSWS